MKETSKEFVTLEEMAKNSRIEIQRQNTEIKHQSVKSVTQLTPEIIADARKIGINPEVLLNEIKRLKGESLLPELSIPHESSNIQTFSFLNKEKKPKKNEKSKTIVIGVLFIILILVVVVGLILFATGYGG